MKRILFLCYLFCFSFLSAQAKIKANVYASYYGGSGMEANTYISVDKLGNVILAGHTFSTDLKLKIPLDSTFGCGTPQCEDGFVTKFNSDMTEIIFSTYLGGNGYDEIKDIDLDSLGNIYVIGSTTSTDFPITKNAYDASYNGDAGPGSFGDVFLTKLSPKGELLYSTYIGGSIGDCGYGISVIDTSTVCIVGNTKSSDFPKLGFANINNGGYDLFLFKLNLSNNMMLFSRYIGGSSDERPLDIQVDKSGNIYICGYTKSSDFPTQNGLASLYTGQQDGFISKFSKDGNLVYSSLIGGNGNDGINGIDINDKDEVYFIGGSNSSGLSCTQNAFFRNIIGGFDIILGKVNSSGDSLLYFSFFGGSSDENAVYMANPYYYGRIKLIEDDNVVITGVTNSPDFPLSDYTYQNKLQGSQDIFVSVLNTARKKILYSSYFGGFNDENAESMITNDSNVYISGSTASTDFPTTPDAFERIIRGNGDVILLRLKLKDVTN